LNLNTELPPPVEAKRLASWGTDVPDDLVLDDKLLAEALKKVNFIILVVFLLVLNISTFLRILPLEVAFITSLGLS
jgi:hypothetical protein